MGQTAGFSDALSLPAVRVALEIHGVPRPIWPEMTQRLLAVHSGVLEDEKRQQRKAKHGR